jgi:hypothetical protein
LFPASDKNAKSKLSEKLFEIVRAILFEGFFGESYHAPNVGSFHNSPTTEFELFFQTFSRK